jgi:tRNA threonylcarbamoyladenosine modification (KEOPS) complex  Pcc1 subunit
MDNVTLLQGTLSSLTEVTAEKTSDSFAQMVVETILQSLNRKFPFLSTVHFTSRNHPKVPEEVNSLDESELGKAIEAIIRLVYMNLEKQAGLFFITELEKHAEPGIIPQIREIGVDLELMQIEHHQLYRTKTTDFNNSNNDESEQKSPSELDEKNNTTFPNPTQNEIKLLELLQQKDIDSIEARSSLRISKEELDDMIVNLLNAEYLHYISNDEVKLTNKAITFLAQKNNKQFV